MTNPDRIEGKGSEFLRRVASSRALQKLRHASESTRDVGLGLTAVAEFAVGVPVAIYTIPRLLKTVVEFPSGAQVDWESVNERDRKPATYDKGTRKLVIPDGGTAIFRVGGVNGMNGRVEDGKGATPKHPTRSGGATLRWGIGWDPNSQKYRIRNIKGLRKINNGKIDITGIVEGKVLRVTHSFRSSIKPPKSS